MSKVDDIVAARKGMPELPRLALANRTWLFEVEGGGVLACQRADGWIDKEQVHALVTWLIDCYGLPPSAVKIIEETAARVATEAFEKVKAKAIQDAVDEARDDAARDAEERR